MAESINEKHVWIRKTWYYGEHGNLKSHITVKCYKCEKCGMEINDETYEKLLKEDK